MNEYRLAGVNVIYLAAGQSTKIRYIPCTAYPTP